MAPTASGIGLRVRLLNTNRRKGNAYIADSSPPARYAVNLDSSQVKFGRDLVAAAAAGLQAQAYVSETDIEGAHWYRLRVGPFASRAEAERVLKIAQAQYPRAWLAVDDEHTDLSVIERAGVQSSPLGKTHRCSAAGRRARGDLERCAHGAQAHRFPEAVDLLNRLLRQPEYPARADAQELLGLVRERAGQLAQAKAEYQEYLQRYPQGRARHASVCACRLLALASLAAQTRRPGSSARRRPGNRLTLARERRRRLSIRQDQIARRCVTARRPIRESALVYGDLLLRDRGDVTTLPPASNAGYTPIW